MLSLAAGPVAVPCMFPQVKIESQRRPKFGLIGSHHTRSGAQSLYFGKRRPTICAIQLQPTPVTCTAGLNARCGVEQTKTITRFGAQSLFFSGRQGNIHPSQTQFASMLCAATLQGARCGAQQTQTITQEAPTITSLRGKEKLPALDDGSIGLPRDLGGGNSGRPPRGDGGGGGGGGGTWWGGFFFFAFLVFLSFLKDEESKDPYNSDYDP